MNDEIKTDVAVQIIEGYYFLAIESELMEDYWDVWYSVDGRNWSLGVTAEIGLEVAIKQAQIVKLRAELFALKKQNRQEE